MAPSNPNPPLRNLDVKKFAVSRYRELESLHSVISARLNGDFKIRRNKRRRTTDFRSSKKKRRRIRKDSNSGPDPNRQPSRRVRRSNELRSNPDSGFVRSGDGTKRLRTHVWHAKRFTMVKRWGFYLPLGLQGRGRGSRAVLRWSESGVLVHDASYCYPIQLEGPEDAILVILRMVLLPFPLSNADEISLSVNCGVCYKNAMLYKVGTPSQFIAPVSYMWRPFSKEEKYNTEHDHGLRNCVMLSRQLWIWIHAAASEEALDSLKVACQKQMHESGVAVSCTSLEGRIARVDVMGSKTIQIIQKILDPVSETHSEYDDLQSVSSYMRPCTNSEFPKSFALQHAEHLPCHAVLSLKVRDPRDISSTVTEADVGNTTSLQQNGQENDTQSLNPYVSTASASCEGDIVALWSNPKGNGTFISESKPLWDSNEKLNPPIPEDILCRRRHQKRLKHFCIDATKDEKLALEASEGFNKFCSILLLKHANRGNFNTRCSIVLPLSWVKAFWNSLVLHGARAIGLREMRWISSNSGLPCFPYDFPECKAYSSLMADEAIAFDESAERRPLAVRPSRVPIPPPWECIESTCKHGFEELNSDSIQMPDQQLYSSRTSEPSSSEQTGSLFSGFVLRFADGLGKYMEKIDHGGSNCVASERDTCFVRVLVRAYKEGVFEQGAIVCAPTLSDLPRWESRLEDDKLEIPPSLIRSYFTQQDSNKWELQLPDSSTLESYRWPIGFVTSGFVRGSKKPTAVAFCHVRLLAQLREQQSREVVQQSREVVQQLREQQSREVVQNEGHLEIRVLIRNLRSAAYRRAFARILLEEELEDTEFM